MGRQIRTILPAFMDRQMTLTECLAMIETEVGKYRGAAGSQKEEQKQTSTLQKQGISSKN